jgi:small subunit ribosomal protein S25e
MGGAKKRSLAQAEKQQSIQTEKQDKKPATAKPKTVAEKKVGSNDLPNLTENELMAELSKMRAITPYQVASKYSVKLGVAKNLLSKMEQRGYIKMVSRNGNVKIYSALGAAA